MPSPTLNFDPRGPHIPSCSLSHRELAMQLSVEIDALLLQAATPNAGFQGLYLLFKRHSRKMSLSFLCRKLQLASKGSLALTMQGKRRVSGAAALRIPEIFHLTPRQTGVWLALVAARAPRQSRARPCRSSTAS